MTWEHLWDWSHKSFLSTYRTILLNCSWWVSRACYGIDSIENQRIHCGLLDLGEPLLKIVFSWILRSFSFLGLSLFWMSSLFLRLSSILHCLYFSSTTIYSNKSQVIYNYITWQGNSVTDPASKGFKATLMLLIIVNTNSSVKCRHVSSRPGSLLHPWKQHQVHSHLSSTVTRTARTREGWWWANALPAVTEPYLY